MAQWGFYFNQDRCLGCKTCMLACKTSNERYRGDADVNAYSEKAIADKHCVNVGEMDKASAYIDSTGGNNYAEDRKYYMKENWRRVSTNDSGEVSINADNSFKTTFERDYLSVSCNHCNDCACMQACPAGVFYKDEDKGLTLLRRSLCISCGQCLTACPFGAPQMYRSDYGSFAQNDPERPRVTKCTLCKDRIDNNLKPACVAACWNRALDAGPIEELKAKYPDYKETVAGFPTNNTKPAIVFKAKANKIGL